MTTQKQRQAAKENIGKAQERWRSLSKRERSRRQPTGRSREKPGAGSEGDYYHVEVRDKRQFSSFRTHDIGEEGHTQRVAGRRPSGSWDTQKWLISKADAHVEKGRLVADREETAEVLEQLGSVPRRVRGDRFEAKPRPDVPEHEKPTPAQRRARQENITKAQEAAQRRDTRAYEQRTYDELYALAREREIDGRSSMDKEELISSLRAAKT